MSFAASVRVSLAKSFHFRGLASRREYWYFALFVFLVQLVLQVFDGLIGKALGVVNFNALQIASSVLFTVPQLSITARRFRDAGISAKWLFSYLLPATALVWAAPKLFGFLQLRGEPTEVQILEAATAIGPLVFSTIVVGIFVLVVTVLPTKPFAAGNRFAQPVEGDIHPDELKRQGW